jgi:hypothetical protein
VLNDGGFAVRLQDLHQAGNGKNLPRRGGFIGIRRLTASGQEEKKQDGGNGSYSHGG